MRKKRVIGNWKMHGCLIANQERLQILRAANYPAELAVAVCVPYPYLGQSQQQLAGSQVAWGAQDVSVHAKEGAFTGEVNAAMLADFACTYVLVGHSERRAYHGETDDCVAEKMVQVCALGMYAVVCVGETLAQREAGQTEAVVAAQLESVLKRIAILKKESPLDASGCLSRLVLAYEPVWAIGTGKTATADEAQAVHAFLRAQIALYDPVVATSVSILYGGSVKPNNAVELFAMPDIDGGLIGGAALNAEDFLQICRATSVVKTTA